MTRSTALLIALLIAACGGEQPGGPAPQTPRPPVPSLAAPDLPPARTRIWRTDELPQLLGPVLPEVGAAAQVELARRTAEGDDWESERLHARSIPVLRGLLDALLLGEVDLAPFLALPFEGATALRPAALQQVFHSGSLRVLEPEPGLEEPGELGDATALAAAAAELRAALGDADAPRAEPIVVAVEPTGEGRFDTRVLLQLDGEGADGPVQVNTEWTLGWALDEGGTPRVSALRRTRYQEVRAAAPLLLEATAAAFGAAPFWRSEFLRGVDDYYMRIDRSAGLSFQGMQGLAVGDVNGDGLDDVYVCQQVGLPNRLLVRNQDGTTTDRAPQAAVDYLDLSRSALIVDLDNDGDRDLVMALANRLQVAYNDGRGGFTRQVALQAEGAEQFFSVSAADPDGDGDLDLYACRYSLGGVMHGAPDPYHDADNGASNYYWRNDGVGQFTDATAEAGFDANNRKFSLSSLWEDLDDDGDLDLYVINDFGRNNLWRNDGTGHFEDVAAALGAEDIGAGMGITCADYDLDGDLDLYVTNMFAASGLRTASQERFLGGRRPELRRWYVKHAAGNTLLERQADGRFEDVTARAGVGRGGWAWGSKFTDLDSDGYPDLYVPNGQTTSRRDAFDLEGYFWRRVVSQSPVDSSSMELYGVTFDAIQDMCMFQFQSWNGNERNNAYLNLRNGRFAEISHVSGAGFVEDSRCVALLDWDDDGREDLLIKGRTAPRLRLLLDRSDSGHHFLSFDLVQVHGNRDAIGARVTVTVDGQPRARTIYAGDGYLCQSSRRLIFGLGAAGQVDEVAVRWTDGSTTRHGGLAVDRRWRLEQGRPEAVELPRQPAPAVSAALPAPAAWDPTPVDRIVLAARLPMAPFPLPAFEGPQRRIGDFEGRPLLVHLWTAGHESGPLALADLVAAAPALEALGVAVVCLSVDEGLELSRARKRSEQTPFAADAGYLDGRTREAFRFAVLEVLGFFDGVPLPTTILLDTAGQACVLYVGPPDARQVVEDAALVARLNPRMRGTLRLSGGRWTRPRQRDWDTLARVYGMTGFEELSSFYAEQAARGQAGADDDQDE